MRSPSRNGSSSRGRASFGSASSPSNGHSSPEIGEPESTKGKRLNPIKRKQMEERIHQVEENIARVEAAIAQHETALLTFVSAEETQTHTKELEDRRSELISLMAEWEELSQTLETAI
jgi:ATP-binding cassette subfamily F protein 3